MSSAYTGCTPGIYTWREPGLWEQIFREHDLFTLGSGQGPDPGKEACFPEGLPTFDGRSAKLPLMISREESLGSDSAAAERGCTSCNDEAAPTAAHCAIPRRCLRVPVGHAYRHESRECSSVAPRGLARLSP